MITALRALALAATALTLSACGSEPAQPENDAESFAARIGGADTATAPGAAPAPAATATPTVATPLPGAAAGPFAKGTLTDPASKTCGAPLMGGFIGKLADQPTRAEIARMLGRTNNLRFVAVGSGLNVNPDPTNPRLSIMLDAQNIIRDARCG
ncbi:MAG: hypothetical protein GW858_10340 [Sphingomonadales bacterium]|nr:hypothetical protein [Sphingomonadales bacterium]NCQ21444.1 hypothetical protein [Sphingomonadales bacterium]NCT04231.1 hypothetical protein [Sphingomonadales bacterium]